MIFGLYLYLGFSLDFFLQTYFHTPAPCLYFLYNLCVLTTKYKGIHFNNGSFLHLTINKYALIKSECYG